MEAPSIEQNNFLSQIDCEAGVLQSGLNELLGIPQDQPTAHIVSKSGTDRGSQIATITVQWGSIPFVHVYGRESERIPRRGVNYPVAIYRITA